MGIIHEDQRGYITSKVTMNNSEAKMRAEPNSEESDSQHHVQVVQTGETLCKNGACKCLLEAIIFFTLLFLPPPLPILLRCYLFKYIRSQIIL